MEDSRDIIENLMDWDIRMVPSENDARSYVLEDSGRNLTSRLIQYVREMVFAEHAMCWVAAMWVGPCFVLVLPACINDCRTSGLELYRDSIDDRAYEGRQKREYEHCQCLGDFLDKSFETWDLLDCC